MAKKDRRVKYQSKEEKPAMLSLRIPQALYDRLERYASAAPPERLRAGADGIEMRLEVEADPGAARLRAPQRRRRSRLTVPVSCERCGI